MKVGVFTVLTDRSIGPSEFARAAEELGYESVFVPEHTHEPVDATSAFPLGGRTPAEYGRTLDPFVALSMMAAATNRLRLGTGVCLVLQHDVISLAKRAATLDLLSGGRLLMGVGAGWNHDELRNHGIDPSTRMAAFVERVSALQRIWSHDEAAFNGTHVRFGPLRSWPKPVQRPSPPVLVGGSHPGAARRAATLGAAWFPNLGRLDDERLAAILTETRAETGDLPCTAFRVKPTAATLNAYRQLGVERCVIALPSGGRDEILRRLEKHASLLAC